IKRLIAVLRARSSACIWQSEAVAASLHTVFSDVVRGTVADGAELFVKVLPVRHHCPNCRTNFEATKDDCPCPECGHPHTEIIGGEELRVLNLDIDDTAA